MSNSASTSRTHDFSECLQRRRQAASLAPPPPPRLKRKRYDADVGSVWMREAERLNSTLMDLIHFLHSIRKAYLDTSHTSSGSRLVDISRGLTGLQKVKWLNDQERNQVDSLVTTSLGQCIESVRSLESVEQLRKQKQDQSYSSQLTKFLGSTPSPLSLLNEHVATHRSSILWYLNQRLTEVGTLQKKQQEELVSKRFQKTNQLTNNTSQPNHEKLVIGSDGIPTIYKPNPSQLLQDAEGEESSIDSTLTPDQVQQFESESNALLRETQSTLSSLHVAEQKLVTISQLQTQLVIHLTQQSELTDQLWQDSMISTEKVEQGNTQLKRAKEQNRQSRIWFIVFLMGSSFALLFVDYMAG